MSLSAIGADAGNSDNVNDMANSNSTGEDEFDEDDDGGTFLGYIYPTKDELKGKAGRTELYQCHKCHKYTRFPRFNAATSVLQAERGRCGEYSMLLYRMLRALGHESHWVVDWADHVWAEIYLNDRWIHLDPCEAAVDEPLLYEGWGKKQTYIVGFHAPRLPHQQDGTGTTTTTPAAAAALDSVFATTAADSQMPTIEDVTQYYTSSNSTVIQGRREESAESIQESVQETAKSLKAKQRELFMSKTDKKAERG